MDQPTSKDCTLCGIVKPLTAFTRGDGRYGLKPWCRECCSKRRREWNLANPDKIAAQPNRKNRQHHAVRKYSAARYAANKAEILARRRGYRARYAARTSEQIAKDRARLRPTGTKVCRSCLKDLPLGGFSSSRVQPDGLVDSCRNCRRARSLTPELLAWWEANNMSLEVCTYCGAADKHMHVDHIVPRWHGGVDEPFNLAPACQQCNTSKGRLLLVEWLTEA